MIDPTEWATRHDPQNALLFAAMLRRMDETEPGFRR
jgi:hypothetical protein